MRVTATAKYIRISPRKVRLVTSLIAGKPVEEAAAILRFLPNAAAKDVAKVLKSATQMTTAAARNFPTITCQMGTGMVVINSMVP